MLSGRPLLLVGARPGCVSDCAALRSNCVLGRRACEDARASPGCNLFDDRLR